MTEPFTVLCNLNLVTMRMYSFESAQVLAIVVVCNKITQACIECEALSVDVCI
jgi:hypothetical protein